jgi:hypothetical protein
MLVIVFSSCINAAVVDPVGLNALIIERKRRRSHIVRGIQKVMVRSMILVSTGVMDIGLKSECCKGTATLDTGIIVAVFH